MDFPTPMHRSIATDTPDIRIVRRDLAGAREWMAAVCGPHWLKVGAPTRLQFQHAGNVLKSMSTTMGVIEYGTDVTVGIRDDQPLNCYSVSLPLSGQQELATGGGLLLSDHDTGIVLAPDIPQELTIAGNCRKILVAITRPAMRQVLEERRQAIQGEMEQAEATRKKADQELEQYRAQIAAAREEANRIIEEARTSADQVRRDLVAKAEEDAQATLDRAAEEIHAERDRAFQELRDQIGAISVELAERVVGQSLDEAAHRRLIDEFIDEVASSSRSSNGHGQAGV